ncbi:hypothetical protein BGZ98_004728, partial [Dissophora globulifera]
GVAETFLMLTDELADNVRTDVVNYQDRVTVVLQKLKELKVIQPASDQLHLENLNTRLANRTESEGSQNPATHEPESPDGSVDEGEDEEDENRHDDTEDVGEIGFTKDLQC